MAEPTETGSPDADLLEEARANYKLAEEYWARNQRLWLEDAKFRDLDQWPAEVKAMRGDERPCLVVDKCNQHVRQVVNDGRQNRPAVKVRPVDDKGDEEIAEAFQGIIRNICDRSDAADAFDTALDHAAGNGFGYFRIITDYAHKNTFNQEILVQRVRNPLAVLLDPNARAADGSDARWGFIVDDLPKAEFKKTYPDAKFTNWDADTSHYGDGWLSGENVRFAEYFYKVEEPRTMHLLDDGTTVSDADYQLALANPNPTVPVPKIVDTRDIPECGVRWCRMSGAEVLERNDSWPNKNNPATYIPLIPVYGNESDIGGKVTYSGLIRAAKDPQRLYNYMRSHFAEHVALASKSPYIAAEGQLEGHEDEWKNNNIDPQAVLIYKPTTLDEQPVPPPRREPPPSIPEAYARDMQLSEHDIQASMGMYAASLGEKSNEKSGRAIMARQREGDTATFHYMDNLNRAIRYLGRQLVDLIPKVYDSKRVVRILGEDGTAEAAQIDPSQQDAVQEVGGNKIYNLSVGTYDVSVSAGPSYTTKRQEALEAQMQLVQAKPELFQLIGDIMVRNADWPGADEIADRLKLMLPPQIQQAEQGQAQLPPEVQQAMQQVQQQQQVLQQAHDQLQAMAQQIQQDKAATDADRAKLDAAREKLQSEEKILMARYGELSAKLELQAMKALQAVPPVMPAGKQEPAIDPNSRPPPPEEPDPVMVNPPPQPNQPPSGGFFAPGA